MDCIKSILGKCTLANSAALATTTSLSTFESKLPAELRLTIYELALIFEKPLRYGRLPWDADMPHSAASLLMINKRIRSEAYDIFYRNNMFSISLDDVCTIRGRWVSSIMTAHPYKAIEVRCILGTNNIEQVDVLTNYIRKTNPTGLESVVCSVERDTFQVLMDRCTKKRLPFTGDVIVRKNVDVLTGAGVLERQAAVDGQPKSRYEVRVITTIWSTLATLPPDDACIQMSQYVIPIPADIAGLALVYPELVIAIKTQLASHYVVCKSRGKPVLPVVESKEEKSEFGWWMSNSTLLQRLRV